jgi:hypothetical protein
MSTVVAYLMATVLLWVFVAAVFLALLMMASEADDAIGRERMECERDDESGRPVADVV